MIFKYPRQGSYLITQNDLVSDSIRFFENNADDRGQHFHLAFQFLKIEFDICPSYLWLENEVITNVILDLIYIFLIIEVMLSMFIDVEEKQLVFGNRHPTFSI
jgi:hypothetical protein